MRQFRCDACGLQHEPKQCSAFGKQCHACGGRNHFARQCRKSRSGPVWRYSDTAVVGIDETHPAAAGVGHINVLRASGGDPEELLILTLGSHDPMETHGNKSAPTSEVHASETSASLEKILVRMKVNERMIKCQLDCGAVCNVIREEDSPPQAKLEPTKTVLRMYDGTHMKPLGKYRCLLMNPRNSMQREESFIVVQKSSAPVSLIGVKTCLEMNLLKLQDHNIAPVHAAELSLPLTKEAVLHEFGDLFGEDLGSIPGEVKIWAAFQVR